MNLAISIDPGIWLAAFFMLAAMSYVYKESELYRLAEHSLVGATSGVITVLAYQNVIGTGINPILNGTNILMIVPILLGLLLYIRFMKGFEWLNRWPVAIISGVGAGVVLRRTLTTDIIGQISATILPLNTFDNIIIIVSVLTVLGYFIFTVNPNGVAKYPSKIGRYVMMVWFGAKFAAVVSLRISLILGVLQFLLWNWLGFSIT